MFEEIGNNVVYQSYVFHKSFVNSYKGMNVVECRRKLQQFYTHGIQDKIIKYLKYKYIIKTEI